MRKLRAMKFFKEVMIILCVLLMVAGCTSPNSQTTENIDTNEVEETEEIIQEEPIRVGLLLPGPISDMGWNATAYNGLQRIKENYDDVEVSYIESIGQSDREEVFRNYAEQGFDLLIGHGFGFSDAAATVAEDYPDTEFVVVSGTSINNSNLSAVAMDDVQRGFIAGALAAMITESDTIGTIGGMNIPPITLAIKGYDAGAKYVKPEIECLKTMLEDSNDVSAAKGIAIAMIDAGADVLMAVADAGSLGAIEAAQEKDTFYVGMNSDVHDNAPEVVVSSVIVDSEVMFTTVFEKYLDNDLNGERFAVGIKEGAIYLAPWFGFEDKISDEIKDELNTIIEDLGSGKLNHADLAEQITL